MIGLTAGGILNIILDPLFINTFEMGISGAAVATLISQAVSFIILLSMFVFKKSIITLSPKYITKEAWVYADVLKIGFPSLCRQGLASIATIFLNNQAGAFGGDPALDAMSIVSKIFMVVFSVSLGIGQGYQPVCGYNYFAKKYDRVKEAMIFTLICGFSLMLLTCIILFIFAENVMSLFVSGHADVVAIGSRVIRYQSLAMPFLSLNVIANMSFQSTKKKIAATVLSCCRQGIFFIPFIFALPAIFKLGGVEMTQALSDFGTFLFTIPFFIKFVKELNSKIKKQREEEKTLELA
jgi:Na+-driven multidrug efflux pump